MAGIDFADIGKVRAIDTLYEGTPYETYRDDWFETSSKGYVTTVTGLYSEGTDFNLVYFPLKHLGYKCVVATTGQLYAVMSHPRTLGVTLGVSSKLNLDKVRELWQGVVAAAREHGYKHVNLDLVPSVNGLTISMAATGETAYVQGKRRSVARSKDLICVSGSLGAAYMGMRLLEKGRVAFENGEQLPLEEYRMIVGAYLKPELNPGIISALEESEVYPSFGYFVNHGLADTLKRLGRDSGFGVKVYADRIPFEGNTFQLGKELDIDPISAAMNGGDDCRLLFTIPILSLEKFRRDFQSFDIIGHLAQPEAGAVMVTPEGVELPLKAQGWMDGEDL